METAIGEEIDRDGNLEMGERIFQGKRLFNTKLGVTDAEDTLPSLFTEETFEDGSNAGQVVELDPMLADYYERRGWNAEGRLRGGAQFARDGPHHPGDRRSVNSCVGSSIGPRLVAGKDILGKLSTTRRPTYRQRCKDSRI